MKTTKEPTAKHLAAFIALAIFIAFFLSATVNDWGFFAHRRINRLAVLTLPPEMMVFFKPHIDWISDHATDADMRRYATSWEAPRHYIDLDQYGIYPYDALPRRLAAALMLNTDVYGITGERDTVLLLGAGRPAPDSLLPNWRAFFSRHLVQAYYAADPVLDTDSLFHQVGIRVQAAFFRERLNEHGILPWNLQRMQRQLTAAFRRGDSKRILRLCADMGHYIGDAHVPLHTTSNYNGQKTGQHGIHGFWESRIPELFADEQYDYFVGKPAYIAYPDSFFWEIVLASNRQVDSVLTLERMLRNTWPADRQMCPELRNGRSLVAPCPEYAAAYQDMLDGMVERRFRAAIHAVASAWFTAWVDAGQPDLTRLDQVAADGSTREEDALLLQQSESGRMLGRPEEH